jgi:hypothetical protein
VAIESSMTVLIYWMVDLLDVLLNEEGFRMFFSLFATVTLARNANFQACQED